MRVRYKSLRRRRDVSAAPARGETGCADFGFGAAVGAHQPPAVRREHLGLSMGVEFDPGLGGAPANSDRALDARSP